MKMTVLKQFLLVNQSMVLWLIGVANCWFTVIPKYTPVN